MMTLHTRTVENSINTISVYWSTGQQHKGVIEVDTTSLKEDTALIAELVALRHLVFHAGVFNRTPTSGKGYCLVVSKGAIKKIAQGKSSKEHAVQYAGFLNTRLKGVKIEVSHDNNFINDIDTPAVMIVPGSEFTENHDRIETPAMGAVYITKHAVEKYADRISTGEPQNPWASLAKRLSHPALQMKPLPDNVLKHKARKYGGADNVEAWSNPTSKFIYLVINDQGRRTVVTVFERKPEYRDDQ